MVCRGALNTVASPLRLAAPLTRALRRLTPAALSLAREMLLRPQQMPVTRFNSVVSPHRVFETRRFKLDDFRAIRALVDGATYNDAVLAVCGGALRRYLDAQGELPAASLTAIAPVYVRDADAEPGSRPAVSWLHVKLGTDIADPVQRLRDIQAQVHSSAALERALGARELSEIGRHAPAATLALTSKMLGRVALGIGRHAPLANCTITSVPGPNVPLYLCGARMTYFSAIMPIADGMGLVFAVTSYDGRIVISPTSCRELLPDPTAFVHCLRASFQEYRDLAMRTDRRRTSARKAVKPPRPRPPADDKASPTRLAA
jgi:WS/DGAT/MGAT family acyltransferase